MMEIVAATSAAVNHHPPETGFLIARFPAD
jgi:hypothetical protein